MEMSLFSREKMSYVIMNNLRNIADCASNSDFVPQIYPDEGHFLHSDGTQQHLSQSLVNFFEECFRKPEKGEDDSKEDENDS